MRQQGDVSESVPPRLDIEEVMQKAGSENFSVASRLLPRRYRAHLLALYGYARFVDDLGDLAEGDRGTQLGWAEDEIGRALAGTATHPIFVRAGGSARTLNIDLKPFVDLIDANRQDQVVTHYDSYEQLLSYCDLSANPVGQMVLAVFGARSSTTVPLSDAVCSALQLIEHFQDVVEDYEAGRVYLPKEDLDRFGVREAELAGPKVSPAFRSLMAFEAYRARMLLNSGVPLMSHVKGAARVAIAGFIGGGLAQLNAIEAADFDVLSRPVKASKSALIRRSLGTYLRGGRHVKPRSG